MSHINSDSFAVLGSAGNSAIGANTTQPNWLTSQNWNWLSAGNGRYSGQCALGMPASNSVLLAQTLSFPNGNVRVVMCRVSFIHIPALTGTSEGLYICLADGSNLQCSLNFRSDGALILKTGTGAGAVVATYAGAFVSNVWTAFEFQFFIDSVNGVFTVLKNGNTNTGAPDFQATGLNLRGGSTNNYANNIQLWTGGAAATIGANNQRFCDWLSWDLMNGTYPNFLGLGDIRSYTTQPAGDSSVQFSQSPTTLQQNFGPGPFGGLTQSSGANSANWISIGSRENDWLVKQFTIFPNGTSGGALTQAAVYFDNGSNFPGNFEVGSVSSQNVGFTSGVPLTFTWAGSGGLLPKNTTIWMSFATNTSLPFPSSSVGSHNIYTLSTAYSTGSMPSTAAGASFISFPMANYQLTLAVPAGNYAEVSEAAPDGDGTIVFDSIVGHQDLYTNSGVSPLPSSIGFAKSMFYYRKTDVFDKQVVTRLKSGATVSDSPTYHLLTTYGMVVQIYPTDPATGLAWGGTNFNNALFGPVIKN